MTEPEANLYRWFEVFTLGVTFDPDDHRAKLALDRGYVKKRRGLDEYEITPAGWEWFTVRSSQIIARCNAGVHDMRPKSPYCVGLHCQWCGESDAENCAECVKFFLSGTIEGGWKTPLMPTTDTTPRSTIHHGKDWE